MGFVVQWFRSWSEFQKEDFVQVLARHLKKEGDTSASKGEDLQVSSLVNGVHQLSTTGRPPSLFLCQVKLFNEWWASWSQADRDKMTAMLKDADAGFYQEVESVINGTKTKLNEDFMIVPESDAVVEGSEDGVNGTEKPRPEPPVFNVTKVIINHGPSSITSSIDGERESRADDVSATSNGANAVIAENGGSESEAQQASSDPEPVPNGEEASTSPTEPVATEV
jgi:hypothetical protein